ncbi:MAG: alpha/beta hydrolase [bacterium]
MPSSHLFKKGPVGCLLIHGFTGSPNELFELGEYLSKENLTVSIPMLPGHGTYSADLLNYTWRDWFERVKASYHELSDMCEEVYVAGLSMGGTLALHLAAHYPVHGVISMAAVIKLPTWKKIFAKNLDGLIKFRRKRGGEDVRDESAKSQLESYQRYPLKSVEQLFQLLDHVRNDLPEISAPILILHSKYDHTVPFSNSELIYHLVGSFDKRKVDLEQSYHVITVDFDKEKLKEEAFNFINSHSKILKTKSKKTIAAGGVSKTGV